MVSNEVVHMYYRICYRQQRKITRFLELHAIEYTPETFEQFNHYGALDDTQRFVVFIGEACDPHPRKKYTEWVVNKIAESTDKGWEVSPTILRDLLSFYHTFKDLFMVELRDIYSFPDLYIFSEVMEICKDTYKDEIAKRNSDTLDDLVTKEEAEVVQEGPPKIIHIKSTRASQVLSRGTKWCFNSIIENAFERYAPNGAVYFCRSKLDSFAIMHSYNPNEDFIEIRDDLNEIADYIPQEYLVVIKRHFETKVRPSILV